MLSSQIKSNEIVFGSCNKDLLEEIIFYGIGPVSYTHLRAHETR